MPIHINYNIPEYTWIYQNLNQNNEAEAEHQISNVESISHLKTLKKNFMQEYNNKRKSCKDTMKVLPTSNYTRQVIDAKKQKLRERPSQDS